MTQFKTIGRGGLLCSAALALALGGCATVPTKRLGGGGAPETISTNLINQIVCEIGQAERVDALKGVRVTPAQKSRGLTQRTPTNDEPTPHGKYAIEAQLTITAETSAALTPNLNFIHPFATEGLSRTMIVGGELSQKGSRQITETFTIDVEKIEGCVAEKDRVKGTFGISQLIDHQLADTRVLPKGVASAKDDDDVDFGATIEFSITRGVNGGPHWVRTKFVGPGDGGLASARRTDTNKLFVSFSKAPAGKPEEGAAKAKRLLDRMILENLNIRTRP